MKKITIIICDDHQIFRQGLSRIIKDQASMKILADCGDGNAAIQLIRKLKPDIAILDIAMPEMDGIEVARLVDSENLSTKIIILTMYKEKVYFDKAMDAGVKGYLLKENATVDLLSCINKVANGEYYVSSLLSNLLIEREKRIKSFRQEIPAIETLTETERKVLELIAENKTSKEIADGLFISYRTVENHRQHICDKLDMHGPHKLLEFALEHKSNL
ncbi:MAG: response regulator transcription factor [Calditrichia bacterium]|nr:response regulator transcription factor [Calditrichia bacterium]